MTDENKALQKWVPMDLDALDQQENEIGFGSSGGNFFDWKDGKSVVRFLPGVHGRQPFIQFWKHFVKGAQDGKAFGGPCPLKMAKQKCVVCMVAAKLSRGSDADLKLADDINPRRRVFANLVDRAAPDAGPQVAEFGKSIYDGVKDYMRTMNEDPTHPGQGFDIVVEKRGSGLNTEYKVFPMRKSSPLHADARQMNEWLDAARDLGQLVVLPTEAEQASRLAGTIIGHLLSGGSGPGRPRSQHARAADAMQEPIDVDVDGDDGNY